MCGGVEEDPFFLVGLTTPHPQSGWVGTNAMYRTRLRFLLSAGRIPIPTTVKMPAESRNCESCGASLVSNQLSSSPTSEE